jgi:hypothetical protein
MATKSESAAMVCRIQVRLDGKAQEALMAFCERKQLSVSAAIRLLCREAGDDPVVAMSRFEGVPEPRRLREAFVPVDRSSVLLRPSLAVNGRKRKGQFIKFFMGGTYDIGVRLDAAAWAGLSVFMQRHGLSVSEAVRWLCCRTKKRVVAVTAGPRYYPRLEWE